MTKIIQISAGETHSLILDLNGNVFSFGEGKYGKLGLDISTVININTPTLIENIKNIIKVKANAYHSLILDLNGNVFAFGENSVKKILKLRMENVVYQC
jgi:alpha-tubulin suppressor-like RCC1 family protein